MWLLSMNVTFEFHPFYVHSNSSFLLIRNTLLDMPVWCLDFSPIFLLPEMKVLKSFIYKSLQVVFFNFSWQISRGASLVAQLVKNLAAMQEFSSAQSLSRVRLLATPWIAARQASLSITNSQSSLKLKSIKLVMPSSHLILCHPLLLPPIPPSIRVFQWVNSSHEVAKVLEFQL